MWELSHGTRGATDERWVQWVILVDEEHGECVASCIDGEKVLLAIRTIDRRTTASTYILRDHNCVLREQRI